MNSGHLATVMLATTVVCGIWFKESVLVIGISFIVIFAYVYGKIAAYSQIKCVKKLVCRMLLKFHFLNNYGKMIGPSLTFSRKKRRFMIFFSFFFFFFFANP